MLCNADVPPGGEGSTLTVTLAGDYADGLLSPGESVDVDFEIGLASTDPFSFFVDIFGTVE